MHWKLSYIIAGRRVNFNYYYFTFGAHDDLTTKSTIMMVKVQINAVLTLCKRNSIYFGLLEFR